MSSPKPASNRSRRFSHQNLRDPSPRGWTTRGKFAKHHKNNQKNKNTAPKTYFFPLFGTFGVNSRRKKQLQPSENLKQMSKNRISQTSLRSKIQLHLICLSTPSRFPASGGGRGLDFSCFFTKNCQKRRTRTKKKQPHRAKQAS